MRGPGYLFIKTLPCKGHYRILRTQRFDAQWENNRLVMYGCFDDRYDTVFVVDTFPEWSPRVIKFKRDEQALRIYQKAKNFLMMHDPAGCMTLLEKQGRNRYCMHSRKGYGNHEITFDIVNDTVSVIDIKEFIY